VFSKTRVLRPGGTPLKREERWFQTERAGVRKGVLIKETGRIAKTGHPDRSRSDSLRVKKGKRRPYGRGNGPAAEGVGVGGGKKRRSFSSPLRRKFLTVQKGGGRFTEDRLRIPSYSLGKVFWFGKKKGNTGGKVGGERGAVVTYVCAGEEAGDRER